MKHVIHLTLVLNLAACALKEPHADKIALASSHNLSAPVSEMERRVAGGDAEAASALARYYEFIELDERKAGYWLKEAARLGGRNEREEYESFKSAMAEFESERQ